MAREKAATKTQLDPGYARAIGDAAGEMAILESRLGEAMAALLKIDARLGRIIYLSSHTPFGRVATLDVIAGEVLPASSQTLAHLKGLTKRARELLTRHHETSHAVFAAAADTKKRVAHGKTLAAQSEAVRALAREVKSATAQLRKA